MACKATPAFEILEHLRQGLRFGHIALVDMTTPWKTTGIMHQGQGNQRAIRSFLLGMFAFKKHGDGGMKFTEKHAKIEKFFADTEDRRKQISIERAEKRALMYSQPPDPLAVAKVAGELFDMKNTLHEKTIAAGLPGHFHRMGHGRHFSHGHNHDFMG